MKKKKRKNFEETRKNRRMKLEMIKILEGQGKRKSYRALKNERQKVA